MNIKKRIVSALMALVMTLSLVNSAVITAFAEETQPAVPSTGETQAESYDLRVLTFEDADYKGGTNFAGKSDWSSLIDSPQYGGSLLYSDGSGTTDVSKAYTWYDAGNTELKHTLPKSWDNYCYWGGGHAVSNYVSGEFTKYGDFNNQLTVYKKDATGLVQTGGGHNGSNNFAVHFGYKDDSGYTDSQILPSFSFGDGVARVIDHMYVNNICYALNCYLNGNGLTAKIDDTDWVKLTATGYNGETKTGDASIYLCNGPKNIIMDWTKFDLSGLGAVTKVDFNVTGSSDNGYGFSQPAYFAYDDVAVRVPHEHVDADKDKKCDTCDADLNQAPVLVEGVTDKTVTIQTGKSYQLDDLMDGKIFTDPDDTLTYENYFYQMSTDDGATWGEVQHFENALFGGVDKSLSQAKEGKYIYRFYAMDGSGVQSDYWTLTLIFSDVITENINFYVGRDQNYDTNGKIYPLLKMYKTAGIDANQFDYVGWFTNGEGKTEYIYNPAAYTIDTTGETNYVVVGEAKYELHDYEEITFTNSAFDASAEDATASNTVVNNYNMFYATLSTGRYSTRAYGWNTETEAYDIYLGGQSLPLPMEKDIYGGGGNDIYLGIVSVYSTTKNENNKYFTADDYYAEMIMPITGSMIHAGVPYTYTRYSSDYTAYPFLSFEAGNGSLYNIYAYPRNTEKYMFNQVINQTTAHTYNVTTKSISIANAVELKATVPADAEFGLYFQYNNFNTKPVTPLGEPTTNEDGTKTITYRISERNSNYTWRLTDPSGKYVTKAGWLDRASATMEKTFTFDTDSATDKKTHDTSKLGSTVSSRDEADIQVFLDHSGFMSVSDTYRVRAFRMWELIDSDTANIMVEPEFNVQMLQGSKDDVKQVNGGNAVGNWIDVKPTGTDIIAVSYDAIDMYATDGTHKTHGGLFPANAPERTGVFVITNDKAGSADAIVSFNGGTTSSRGAEWDYNYDTWYYLDTDKAPTLDFTVTAGASVSYAVVTTNAAMVSTLSDWTDMTADADGVYHADLLKFRDANTLGGTVIIKMTDANGGVSYRLVRVAQMSVTVKNASNGGEPIMPGDKVTLSFDGLYRGVDKVSGIFNPTLLYGNYSAGEDEYKGQLGQYQQMDRTSITLTVPEDITFPEGESVTNYLFTDGYISGSMYSASSPFDTLYNMTDTGVGTNFSAVSISFVASRLADVSVEVAQKVWYNVELNITDEAGKVDGATVVLKGSDGKAIEPQEDGTYKLGYGSYSYSVVKDGYVCYNASFKLGSADASSVQDGKLVKTVELVKAAEGAWDGKTATEPAKDANGVYQISNGAELAWFAQQINKGGNAKISAVLTNDIDLAAYNWTPIGMNSTGKRFAGSFDGQDHKIMNLSIDYQGTTTAAPYQGLFGFVEGSSSKHAEIKNLTVQGNMVLTSNKNVSTACSGGVIGRTDYADITNVHSEVNITVNRVGGNWDNIGGIIGQIYYATNVKDCSYSGTIKTWRYAGGIVGNISSSGSAIINCVNTGTVTCSSTCAAGIVANLSNGSKVVGCVNTGAVTAAGNYAAGIVGYCGNSEVSNCYNAGKVTCNPAFTYGSVIGTVTNASAVIKNNYFAEGTVDHGKGIGSVKDEQNQTAEASDIVARVAAPESAETGKDVTFDIYMNAANGLACAQMDLTVTGGTITAIKQGSGLALGKDGKFKGENGKMSFIGNTASAAEGILVATVTVRVDDFADEVKLTVSDALAGISGDTADKAVGMMNADAVVVDKVYTVSETEFAPGLYLVTYIKAVPEGKSITCNGEGMLLAYESKTVTLMSGDEADALKNSCFAVSDDAAVAVKYGDVNENTKINIVDAQIALDVGKGIYKGTDKVSVAGLLAADVNHDNVVDAKDAYSIQIYVHYNAFTVPAGN